MRRFSKAHRINGDRQLRAGLEHHCAAKVTFVLSGKTFSRADLVRVLDLRIDAAPPVAKARAAWLALAHAEQETVDSTEDIIRDLKQALLLLYGASPDVLADFGLTPRKKTRALSTKEQSKRVALAEATRKARHTMGPRQKRVVRGTVELAASEKESAPFSSTSTQSTGAPRDKINGGARAG
jgi:hypothetical protein